MDVENSFFEFRPSTGSSDASAQDVIDESMRSVDAIDDSVRSDDSFSLLRAAPPSAKKLAHTVINESEDEDDSRTIRNQNYTNDSRTFKNQNYEESPDTSIIGRKTGRRAAVVLSDSDTDDNDDLVASVATRMSILGFKPKGMVEESKYFDSDEANSGLSSRCSSISDLPTVDVKTPRYKETEKNIDHESISESIPQPIGDKIKNNKYVVESDEECIMSSHKSDHEDQISSNRSSPIPVEDIQILDPLVKHEDASSLSPLVKREPDSCDVELIGKNQDVVMISSDEEDEKPPARKSERPDIRKYLAPKSYPNSNVVYVPQHVKTNEVNKMEGLKQDLQKIKYLIENIATCDLPDGGASLKKRLESVESKYREQAEKVANMIVEPEKPTAKDIARDGFGSKEPKKEKDVIEVPSWDELAAASNEVQPRMFGKQAMSTHMAERGVILDRLRDLKESLESRPPETQRAEAPLAVRATLMPHQLHAIAWLRWRETQRPRGGILADDMGLGKTLTMISLMVADKESSLEREEDEEDDDDGEWTGKENKKMVRGGTLVVCPASLLQQWASEVQKHVRPHSLKVCQHHGAARATQPYKLASYDLVITTYNIVSRDLQKSGVLMRVRWQRVVLDEAHIVRNHKACGSRAVAALAAARRWCLTGTPVHNKELDVFALLKFLRCTPFDDIAMWKKWIDNRSAGGQERLATVMRTLLLRRTKLQLQESGDLTCLPDRDKVEITVALSDDEAKIYEKVSLLSRTLFAQYLQQKEDKRNGVLGLADGAGINKAYDRVHRRLVAMHGSRVVRSHEILVLLLRLRQICCHAGLVAAMLDPDCDHADHNASLATPDVLSELDRLNIEDDEDQLNETDPGAPQEGASATEALRSVMSPNNPVFQFDQVSSKIKAVLRCLRDSVLKSKEDKAVIVSQWTSVLSLVERSLRREDIACATLSGAVPVADRGAVVDQINDPASHTRVLLLSLCAGGVGLNLCGANHLLLLDPHWNPQLEEQAQDRVYRVGQAKPVHIYKFITSGTVEEKIKSLQERKLAMASSVLTGARHNNSKLTMDDLKHLFNMGVA